MHNNLDARQRDIFPLPIVAEDCPKFDGLAWKDLSRSKQRRLTRRHRQEAWYSEGIEALNSLLGFSRSDAPGGTRNIGHVNSCDQIRRRYGSVPPPPADMTPAGAFSALRGISSGYDPDPGQGARVSFDLELCSMPPPLIFSAPCLGVTGRRALLSSQRLALSYS